MLSRMLPSLIEWLFLLVGAEKQPGEVPVNAPGGEACAMLQQLPSDRRCLLLKTQQIHDCFSLCRHLCVCTVVVLAIALGTSSAQTEKSQKVQD